MKSYKFICSDENIDKRLDIFLNEHLELSRSSIQKIIDSKNVFVNNKNKNKNYKLRLKDDITINIEEARPLDIVAQDIPLDVVYEDEHIIVVNKPQNMVVHPSNGHIDGTLVNALMHHCKGSLSGINGTIRAGIVHRIDKDTSGVLMVAKNDNAHKSLAKQLEKHSIKREYYAIVSNNLKDDVGTIDAPIGRHKIDRKKMAVTTKNSKNAITHYTVLQRFSKYTLVKLNLETGRTHQIRVHMAYIGNSILGDTVYGAKKQQFGLDKQILHAKTLGFIHPFTNEYVEFDTKLPIYFEKILLKLTGGKYIV